MDVYIYIYFTAQQSRPHAIMGRAVLLCACLLSFLSLTFAKPVGNGDWIQLGKPSPHHQLVLTFAIKQTNPGWLDEKLKAVSYPHSSEYGKYMNFDEIARHVHGRPESVQAVKDALASVDVSPEKTDFTLGMDFAVASISVEAAEKLFLADFYVFQHFKESERTVVKSLGHTIPQSLEGHVDFISGLSEFPRPNLVQPKLSRSYSQPRVTITPSGINTDYNLSDYTSTNPNNSQAIASFLKQYFAPDDLKTFQSDYNVPSNPISKVVGTNLPNEPGIEAELDVEYITAVGRGVPTWFVSISKTANKGQEDFLSWIIELVNTTDAPWVHSASYGDYEHSIPTDYQMRCDDEFKKFGISGRTLLFASGDEGVHCRKQKYIPEWPTCSPYVTSVGGTQTTDEVWTAGGGGFSNTFPIPDYQKAIVEAYLKSGKAPPTKYFNTSGRAYPDVSAFSVDFEIIVDGGEEEVDGTSCATPTFAGVVSCLNDVRLNKGQPTLGFLNPLLYQTLQGKGFHDITKGENSGFGGCPGFKAIEGWDPASGWGSPNFGLLKDLV